MHAHMYSYIDVEVETVRMRTLACDWIFRKFHSAGLRYFDNLTLVQLGAPRGFQSSSSGSPLAICASIIESPPLDFRMP